MTETTLMQNDDIRVVRYSGAGKHPLSLLKHIYVETGTLDDWKLLHELHYKSSALGIGPRYMRCVLDDGSGPQTIGVMVFTVPKPLDSGRNEVFPRLKPNAGGRDNRHINRMRMKWMNNHIILSSRTVLDTMYRGAGIAYRFKNIGYRMMGYRYVESRSSMSRYNPFSVKAGMRFVKPKHSQSLEGGLEFFARYFTSPPFDHVAILEEMQAMSEPLRSNTRQALNDFYYDHSSMEKSGDNRMRGTSRIEKMTDSYLIKQIQQLVFGASVYAVFVNPEWDDVTQSMRPLPARIWLTEFDKQQPNEPLVFDTKG